VHVAVAGGGIFGATAARALARRGHRVTLVDPGPLPHPLAESTDISKMVRLDYGADAGYTELAERALDGWRAWNRAGPAPLFHETGVLFIARAPLAPGGFEHESFALLRARGHRPERLDAADIARRYPALRAGAFVDGYYNPEGGWVEASRVVERVLAEAAALGVTLRAGCAARAVADDGSRLLLADGSALAADAVLVAAGAWTPLLCPALSGALRPHGQAVFHLRPRAPADFAAERLPAFGADIARTGFYGFPLHAGVVKIGHHGPGVETDMQRGERVVPGAIEADLRALLADALPGLADAEIAFRRLCVYCDTRDGHFWIARDPARPRLTVAAGGSGHAFKFAPVLGDLIADAVLGEPVPPRFRWRPEATSAGQEAARYRG
jgi:glycine/D-amino acid oxidase-like deaminating enzyme